MEALELGRVAVIGRKADREVVSSELPSTGLKEPAAERMSVSPGLGGKGADLAPKDFGYLAIRRRGREDDGGAVHAQEPRCQSSGDEGLAAAIGAGHRYALVKHYRLHDL